MFNRKIYKQFIDVCSAIAWFQRFSFLRGEVTMSHQRRRTSGRKSYNITSKITHPLRVNYFL